MKASYIWAPELHYLEGKWYIYFAGGEEEDIWKIRPYVLECQGHPLADAWVEKGKMQRADGDEFRLKHSPDATVFEDAGDYYYVGQKRLSRQADFQSLYCKNGVSVQAGNGAGAFTTPDYDWERGILGK